MFYNTFPRRLFCPCTRGQGTSQAQHCLPPVEFKAQVDKAVATVGDIITLTLSLSSEPQIAVRLPEAGSRIAGLRIVDDGEEGPKLVDNRTVQKKWYKFQPDSAGSYIIPALSVTYTDARGAQQELKSAQLFIEVKSVLKDTERRSDRGDYGISSRSRRSPGLRDSPSYTAP